MLKLREISIEIYLGEVFNNSNFSYCLKDMNNWKSILNKVKSFYSSFFKLKPRFIKSFSPDEKEFNKYNLAIECSSISRLLNDSKKFFNFFYDMSNSKDSDEPPKRFCEKTKKLIHRQLFFTEAIISDNYLFWMFPVKTNDNRTKSSLINSYSTIISHEIGHLFGLEHILSENFFNKTISKSNLMDTFMSDEDRFSFNVELNNLQKEDIIKFLYPS